jgi:hypothetical protein
MASLAFGVVGAAIGSQIGGAFLGVSATMWGWTLASTAASWLLRPDLPTVEVGPRLNDLSVTVSTFGNPIPRVFGTAPCGGNVIWSTPLVEHVVQTEVEVGGKGGSQTQTQISRYYTVSFAVAICAGEIIGIRKIKLNGKLYYDVGENSSPYSVLGSLPGVTIYTGTETQLPDSLIEEHVGTGMVSAYRGMAYVVFRDLNVSEELGNAIPRSIEFEVVASGVAASLVPQQLYTLPDAEVLSDAYTATQAAVRQPTSKAGQTWMLFDVAGNPRRVALVNNYTGELLVSHDTAGDAKLIAVGWNDRLWFWESGGGLRMITTSGALKEIDSFTTQWDPGGVEVEPSVEGIDRDTYAELWGSQAGTAPSQPLLGRAVDLSALTATDISFNTFRTFHLFFHAPAGIAGRIYLSAWVATGSSYGWGYLDLVNSAYVSVESFASANSANGIASTDGYIYVHTTKVGDNDLIRKYDQDHNVVDTLQLPATYTSAAIMAMSDEGMLYAQLGNRIYKINPATMELLASNTLDADYVMVAGDSFEDGILTTRIGTADDEMFVIEPVARITAAPPTLADVVTSIITDDSGLTSGDLDVTDLAALEVTGFTIAQQMTKRDALAALQPRFLYDVTESDYKIKFKRRGAAAAVSIAQDDLGARALADGDGGEPPDPLRTTRGMEIEQPRQIHVTYLNAGFDYQVSKQSGKRIVTESRKEVTINLPLVMTDDQARQLAEVLTFEAWTAREGAYEFETSLKYTKYEPNDVGNITANGITRRIRFTERHEGADGVLRWKGVADLASVYTQGAAGAPGGNTAQSISLSGPTVAEFADTHLLRDADDVPGFYYGARGTTAGWPGQQLYQSRDDGASYGAVHGSETREAADMGYAQTVLADFDAARCEIFDEGNSVDVLMKSGELSSYTRAQIFAGIAPGYLLGNEVFYARSATLVGTDTYRLTGLLRGRKGTRSYMGAHTAGERFMVLNSKLRAIPQALGDSGLALRYKPVTIGASQQRTAARDFTNTNRRLRPLAPVNVRAGLDSSGEITFSWRRCTRYAAPWRDAVDVPLGENVERYEVDVLDGDTVVRTLPATSESVAYTVADQTADFGAAVVQLSFNVYQLSYQYGRGYPAAGSLDIGRQQRYARITDLFRSSGEILLGEFRIYEDGVDITSAATVTLGAAINGGSAGNLTDGSFSTYTTYSDGTYQDEDCWIQFDFGAGNARRVNGLQWATNASFGNRWLQRCALRVSGDGSAFSLVGSTGLVADPGLSAYTAIQTI